ncbi:hypothetical protein MSPP1_002931 [Malassezia sp. CBS 17886]|nr:hypothetical protein MSPP1_002931 [Malassezia sp. CBS 17886]
MAEFQKESLSLAETNRVRTALGLRPLEEAAAPEAAAAGPAPTSQVAQDAVSERNYAEHRAAERATQNAAALRERISKAQNQRDLRRQLRGATLGDAGAAAGTSARQWVKDASRRAKENAARRQRELEEEESAVQQQYRASELAGIRVAHELDDFTGDERILTLRDADVLDDADDELVEVGMDQRERDRLNQERKKGTNAYTGLDDDEFDDDGAPHGAVLSKYDSVEDLDGRHKAQSRDAGFRIGGGGGAGEAQHEEPLAPRARVGVEEGGGKKPSVKKPSPDETGSEKQNPASASLEYPKNVPVSDYEPAPVRFKKGKTHRKPRAATRVKLEADDALPPPDGAAMDVDGPAPVSAARALPTDNLVDDDELEASLAKTRRRSAKRSFTKMTPEMIARNLAAQREAEQTSAGAEGAPEAAAVLDDEQGLTLDETSEFVRHISLRPVEEARTHARQAPDSSERDADDAGDARVADREAADGADDSAPADAVAGGADASAPVDAGMGGAADADVDRAGESDDDDATEEAAPHTAGVADALRLLRSQGILEGTSAAQQERERQQLKHDAWLQQQKAADRRREQERLSSRPQSARDQAQREYENKTRERREAEALQARFRDYNPDVNIEYHDEFGRALTQKEAWKRLSHVFHGNMPGHKAQEKRLRRIADEKRQERMFAGDTSAMTKAFQERSARTGQAHMVLSVGNRDTAPEDLDLLGDDALRATKPAPRPKKGRAPKVKKEEEADATPPPIPVLGEERGRRSVVVPPSGEGGGWGHGAVTPGPESTQGTPAPENTYETPMPETTQGTPAPDTPQGTPAPETKMKPAFARTFQGGAPSGGASIPRSAQDGDRSEGHPGSSAEAVTPLPRGPIKISLGKRKADA